MATVATTSSLVKETGNFLIADTNRLVLIKEVKRTNVTMDKAYV